ncbi:MAG: hypothetical protein HYU68_00605 [Bacteroidetes bacterium]|nr:hypothetical protein [Bacteroidota bacterium]
MKKIISSIVLIGFFIVSLPNLIAQEPINIVGKLKSLTKKGDYAILEVRLNNEDEFRTIEGSNSSLARLALFTGNNEGAELLLKGFEGMNSIVSILNDLKSNGFHLINVYTIKGESLIITHYIIERKK